MFFLHGLNNGFLYYLARLSASVDLEAIVGAVSRSKAAIDAICYGEPVYFSVVSENFCIVVH